MRWDVAGLVASSESCGEYSEKLRGKAAPAKTGGDEGSGGSKPTWSEPLKERAQNLNMQGVPVRNRNLAHIKFILYSAD